MTRAARFRPSASASAPPGRLRAALAASAVVHGLLLSVPLPDLRWQGVATGPVGAPMTVRLTSAPVPAPAIPISAKPEARRPPLPLQPPATDPIYYPARELDDYPRPLEPLRIDRPAGTVEVRLEILIDEHGVVRDVALAAAAGPGRVEDGLRTMLAATRFLPALKDGRPVRSRIVVSVKMGTHTFSEPRIFDEEEGH